MLHAEAAQSVSNLVIVQRDLLHRVTHEPRTPLDGLVGNVDPLTVSETMSRHHNMDDVPTVKRCLDSVLEVCDNVLVTAKEPN